MKVFDYESRARLQRMRNHMAMDKLAKIERGRYGWTRLPKSTVAFNSIGGFLVLSEHSTIIGPKHSNSSPTTKSICAPTYSSKQDIEA